MPLEDCRAELKEAQHHSIAQTHKHASDIESLQGSKDELESNLEALRDSLVDAKFELKRTKAEKQRLADDKVAVLRDLAALKQHFKAEGAESLELAQRRRARVLELRQRRFLALQLRRRRVLARGANATYGENFGLVRISGFGWDGSTLKNPWCELT